MDKHNSAGEGVQQNRRRISAAPLYEYAETGLPRISFAPEADAAVDLMLWIAADWQGRYRVIYVLTETVGHVFETARYEYHGTLDLAALQDFFCRHGAFIVADGRHALWIASAVGRSMLIFDRHGVLTVFGDVAALKERLDAEGCRPGFLVPSARCRTVSAERDGELDALMRGWKWLKRPLTLHDMA